jgi:hypothetical protein
VVTRRCEPAISQGLAGFSEFTTNDTATRRVFSGRTGNQRTTNFGSVTALAGTRLSVRLAGGALNGRARLKKTGAMIALLKRQTD